ncbi:MAG: RagB/SusD family nutrient uptake outer membrane protein, partial [Bacteroidales bacterium]|nr:RagB/SusD family nutrient uptake outer membrane protein [Bacteroidales bacterium]
GNPFQYYFEQLSKCVMPEESIFEWSIKAENGGSRIAYNFGRGSDGGGNAYPPKSNAQSSSYPEIYYGLFDPQDLRRDASLNVTGSHGNGTEKLYNYQLNNKIGLGIGMNKYDLNRQDNPDARQLYSGINYIYMRQADVILMLAEAYAVNGDNGKATTELRKIHDRAFPAAVRDAKFTELLNSVNGDLYEAIIKERELEFIGETLRRWDLIRTGKLPQVSVEFRKQLVDHMAELKQNGYVKFDNGNEFPAWIWTKMMDAKKELGYRLTAQCPEGLDPTSDKYALLFPSWRGQHDDWVSVAVEDGKDASTIVQDNTNVAILGLFKHIDPDSAEAKALEARGYKKTPWGAGSYTKGALGLEPDAGIEAKWTSEFMCGYTDADYAAKKAPIYLIPMNQTTCETTGLTNGYGFRSTMKKN